MRPAFWPPEQAWASVVWAEDTGYHPWVLHFPELNAVLVTDLHRPIAKQYDHSLGVSNDAQQREVRRGRCGRREYSPLLQGHAGSGSLRSPTPSPGPPHTPGPHLPQTPLHVAGKEPQDSQLGTKWAWDIPQGEGP